MGVTVAVFATLCLIALIAVGMVKGPDSASPMPANTQQYLSHQRERPLTSLDFIQSRVDVPQTQDDDYPRSTDGLTLPQVTNR